MENHLAASEARFSAVWESSADAMALSDSNGIVMAVNPAYHDLYGYTSDKVLGHSFAIIFPESQREQVIAEYRRFFREGENRSGVEAEVQRSDGTTRAVDVRYAFIEEAGQRVAMLSVIRDVTERTRLRKAEHELARQKDEFLLAVSHDLKNPVATIRGYAQLLQRRLDKAGEGDQSGLRDGLNHIEETAKRMNQLIEDLVDATTIGMDHQVQLRRAQVDLVAIVRTLVSQHQVQANEGHDIVVQAAQETIVGTWDAGQLSRVIDNLLSNAVKYSANDVHIVVSVKQESDDVGAWAVLQVADEGIGIAEADLPHIFERFYRAENVRNGVVGSGLGLVGVRHIVERHGGSITVESVEGEGTTFTVRLPLTVAPS